MRIALLCLPLTVWFLWAAYSLYAALAGFQFDDQVRSGGTLMVGCVLTLFLFAACFLQRPRWPAVSALILLVASIPGLFFLRQARLAHGVEQLERVYQAVAHQGPPFPEKFDPTPIQVPHSMQWYYQKHSDDRFAVVYIVSSDGYTMEYPNEEWVWIGYYPNGYEPRRS